MTLRAPEPLAAQHRLEGFDCGKPALNDWLLRHARQAQGSGSAKTFVVAEDDGRVAGYFSLTVGQVDTLEAPERIRKGMGQYPLPVVILARLAVSVADQGRGIGFGLLQDAIRRTMLIAEQAGIRAMLTHPVRVHRVTAARTAIAAALEGRPSLGPLNYDHRITAYFHQASSSALGVHPCRHPPATAVQRLVWPVPSRNHDHQFQRHHQGWRLAAGGQVRRMPQ